MSRRGRADDPREPPVEQEPPVIPDRSGDDTDEGWERTEDSDDERYLRDRPPHWR